MLNRFLRNILAAAAIAWLTPAMAQQAGDPLTRLLDSFFKPPAGQAGSGQGGAGQAGSAQQRPAAQPRPAPRAAPAARTQPPAAARPQQPSQAQTTTSPPQKAAAPKAEPAPKPAQPQRQAEPAPKAEPKPAAVEPPKPAAAPPVQAAQPKPEPKPDARPADQRPADQPPARVAEPPRAAPPPAREAPKAAEAPPPPAPATQVAARAPASAPVPTSPAAALARVNDYFNGMDQLTAYFVQRNPNGQQVEGTLAVKRPGILQFVYAPPSTLEIVSDGRNVAIRDKKLGTNDVYPVGQTPLKFLLQENVDLARDTKVRDVQVGREGMVVVRFDDNATFGGTSKITLRFDARANALRQWSIVDSQGYETSVTLSNLNVVHKKDARAAN
jgi:outer membrane lipoprotein-sorting protein